MAFDSAGAMSASSAIHLANGGYVSVTDGSGLTLAALISRVAAGSVTNEGVIGYDTSTGLTGSYLGGNYSGAVDFSALTSDVYLGTASNSMTFSGALSTANGNTGDYFLAAYRYGYLQMASTLSGTKALHIGVSSSDAGTNTQLLSHWPSNQSRPPMKCPMSNRR